MLLWEKKPMQKPHSEFKMYRLGFLLLFLHLTLFSCKTSDESPDLTGIYVKEVQLLRDFNESSLESHLKSIPNTNVSPAFIDLLVAEGIQVYRIVYATIHTDNTEILASGALLIPKIKAGNYPLASLQHGTITDERNAPSNYDRSVETTFVATLLCATGYVVAVPDYIGYGSSKNLPHPYEHRASLGRVCLDMLRAAKEFCQKSSIPLNEKLFLSGYSEGGYATLALHKMIDEQAAGEFTVTASVPAAGAYHKTAFAEFILSSNQNLSFLNNYLWVLDTYNKVYQFNRPWTYFVNEPYATFVANEGYFTNKISYNPQLLFTAGLRNDVLMKKDAAFLNALKDNDIHNWKPKAPVRFIHGSADDFVPAFNSQDAFLAMQALGADVGLELLPGKNHFTAQTDWVTFAFNYFNSLR